MLVEFGFSNYRSFRDRAILSMEATGISNFRNSVMEINNLHLLRGAAIFGKNGGGKSNVIRAFWLAVQFIRNAQKTQHEKAEIPVIPFLLNDYSEKQPTEFSFVYILGGVKYWYSFSATRKKIISETLYHAPKGQKAIVFIRKNQIFTFTDSKSKRKLISETVAENQLFFSVACTMNDKVCINAMRWFREYIYFSRDYTDIPVQLLEYAEDENMLRAISTYAKEADFGIENMRFEFNNKEIDEMEIFSSHVLDGMKTILLEFKKALSAMNNESEISLRVGQVTAKAEHYGIDENGNQKIKLSRSPSIKSVPKRVYGWYFDLNGFSENDQGLARIYTDPIIKSTEEMVITVNVPNVGDSCEGGGHSYIMRGKWAINPYNIKNELTFRS